MNKNSIDFDKLPDEVKIRRKIGLCNAKHPVANFWCWLDYNHIEDGSSPNYHTAGLEDWEVNNDD